MVEDVHLAYGLGRGVTFPLFPFVTICCRIEGVSIQWDIIKDVVVVEHICFPLVVGVCQLWQPVKDVRRRLVILPLARLRIEIHINICSTAADHMHIQTNCKATDAKPLLHTVHTSVSYHSCVVMFASMWACMHAYVCKCGYARMVVCVCVF